jgi:hypothetical protein
VSKLAGVDQWKLLGVSELGEFDSVKKVSIIIDISLDGRRKSGNKSGRAWASKSAENTKKTGELTGLTGWEESGGEEDSRKEAG